MHKGEDYQELTQREENDLEYMISQTENAISNIEAFTEQLSKDLSVLDGVIHEIKILICIVPTRLSLNNLYLVTSKKWPCDSGLNFQEKTWLDPKFSNLVTRKSSLNSKKQEKLVRSGKKCSHW